MCMWLIHSSYDHTSAHRKGISHAHVADTFVMIIHLPIGREYHMCMWRIHSSYDHTSAHRKGISHVHVADTFVL